MGPKFKFDVDQAVVINESGRAAKIVEREHRPGVGPVYLLQEEDCRCWQREDQIRATA